tara:strand:+ start:14 stop:682 length:669 start_codon:yes stop_codon:yes gene_type:complete
MNYTGFVSPIRSAGLPTATEAGYRKCGLMWMLVQRTIALLSILMLSPLFGLMWVLVKFSSPGPFLFSQMRTGLGGRKFSIRKVRTMRLGAEVRTALGVTNGSPEVTRIGKVLRSLKLDELPQLLNIVMGNMSIVGPRPIPLALESELRAAIPGFGKRYDVLPGLTSLGQVCVDDNALGDALVTDWKYRFQGELHYIRKQGFCYDLVMILMTMAFVVRKALKK